MSLAKEQRRSSSSEFQDRSAKSQIFLYPAAFIALGFIVLPLAYIFSRALSGDRANLAMVLFREKTLTVAFTTISLTALVAFFATVLGVAIAWSLHFVAIPLRGQFRALTILPIAIPSYVFAYCWLSLEALDRGFLPALLILTLATAPYVTLTSLASLRRIDLSQLEVARTLGLNNIQTFRIVTFPQIRNSVAAGTLLSALCVVSDFGAVSLMGVDTFTRAIHNTYQGTFDRSTSAILAVILILLATIIIAIESKSRRELSGTRTSTTILNSPEPITSRSIRIIASALVYGYIFFALFIPLSVLGWRFAIRPNPLDISGLANATISSIFVSALGAGFAILLAIPIALLSLRGSKLGSIADRGVLIVHALPGVVMGLALVAFGSDFSFLYQTLPLLAVAYSLLFVAKSVGATRAAIARVPRNLMEISATLGKTRRESFRLVALPLAAPGVLTGALLVLLASMKELPATLMLRPTGFETLATEMWTFTSIYKFSDAAPYALALVLVAAIPTFLIGRPVRKDAEASHLQ